MGLTILKKESLRTKISTNHGDVNGRLGMDSHLWTSQKPCIRFSEYLQGTKRMHSGFQVLVISSNLAVSNARVYLIMHFIILACEISES